GEAGANRPRRLQHETERLQHDRRRSGTRRQEATARPDPKRENAADARAESEGRDEGRPRRRAAEVALRDDRAQHEVRGEEEVADPEKHDRRPDPRLPTELGPPEP